MKRKLVYFGTLMLFVALSAHTQAQEANKLTEKEKKRDGYSCLTAKISPDGDNITEQKCQKTGK